MRIVANGKDRLVPAGSSVADLLATLRLAPAQVLVERNGAPLARADFPTTLLLPGDTLEIAQMVGGG